MSDRNTARPNSSISIDAKLLEAADLFLEDVNDAGDQRLEELLPDLVAAGYAEADEQSWAFTDAGLARRAELVAQS